MIEAIGAAYLATCAIFLYQLKKADERFDTATRLWEGIVTRLKESESDEAKAHRAQISELLTRIQAPKDASYVLGMSGEKQHVSDWDEDAYWENQRELNGDS